MKKNILIFSIIASVMFIGCDKKAEEENPHAYPQVNAYEVGDIITLKGVEGGEKKLKRIKGGFEIIGEDKILILDIFGTFCPPCKEEAPHLTQFQIDFNDKVSLIGLTYLENVSDKYVVENFSDKYNGHYFISNSKQNARIVETIKKDIAYPTQIQLPFKVVIKNGKYQTLTDVWYHKKDTKFYIGNVGIKTIKNDIERILGQ